MESNHNKFVLIITLLSVNFTSVLSNKLIADLLANNLLDKSSILHLLQLFFTAKLLKDYNDAHGIPNDPQTNYMLFLGKGNIQFQNHQLDVENTTEPLVYETTTTSSDLAKNKHLLKFVARNGYDVWKRLLVIPYNSSAEKFDANLTDDTLTESSNRINDMIITTTNFPELHFKAIKPSKDKYDDQYINTLKKLYKPDLQMIETEEGFIKHEVKPPKWVKNIIEKGSEKRSRTSKTMKKMKKNNYLGVDRNVVIKKVRKKAINKSGSARSDKTLPTKYINNKNINNVVISSKKKSAERPTLHSINKKPNTKVNGKKQNNRVGNIVIKGFNGLIRGIGSIMGIDSSQE